VPRRASIDLLIEATDSAVLHGRLATQHVVQNSPRRVAVIEILQDPLEVFPSRLSYVRLGDCAGDRVPDLRKAWTPFNFRNAWDVTDL
jgi:hypothetical protein